ncbi:DNA polymerase III subunit alpha [Streptococcus sciuri]|uniref:DNA polymerase III subunit alpha n=1 Tax=Streptococcus sciuri TaxID=2973939 RepID=A0ABT2F5D4_9STRE|nr:DNA polymerase III subunit alpha [Streptococcus sciuri]MCS4487669.1 DNA polymerase III subunit alpha [Streptococcus sciuri]
MFAQLNTKTVYSFMDSLIDLDHYISRAKELGYQMIGIMDDNMYAAYHFAKKVQKAGLKPVIGAELKLKLDKIEIRVQLIALDSVGYRHLMKLATKAMTTGVKSQDIIEYQVGLAVVVPYQEDLEGLELGVDFFWGVSPKSPQKVYDRPTIAVMTVRYFASSDRESLQVLRAIKANVSLREIPTITQEELFLPIHVVEEMFLSSHPQALTNLESLVKNINYTFDNQLKLPIFNPQVPASRELRQRTEEGLKKKNLWTKSYQDRLYNELAIIHRMGFDDYFLIVWDLLRFGRSRGYYMGMGRGSAAGSLVAYALDITGVDPIRNKLLFERFLNEERFSMPDIDIDLPDIYRGQFLHYVRERYGSNHTAQIVTFSTFGAKQAIRDVFKRFGMPEYDLTNLTRKIGFRDTLSTVYGRNLSFRQLITKRPEYKKAFEIAKRIEGNPRQTSIHAAGVVMIDDDLTDHIPLKSGDDMMITQYDAGAVEANGLLKMDFLGLRNLTFVQKMKEKVLADYGVTIDIASIDLEDKETLTLFASGRTKGIFQFEQAGAISLLKRVKPNCFEDIVATTSLNRPGASDYIDNFINRRFKREKVDLLDPAIASILEPTYGIMLYQEQVMQIAQVYAGFTLGKADLLRRAMSKKKADEMQKMSDDFIKGAVAFGHRREAAEQIFERMAKFAGYGFNRSHAYAYCALAFQIAYFKVHYPDAFYSVMLNDSNTDYITDALEAGYQLVTLSINTIPYRDEVKDKKISLGLVNIKGFPRELADWIHDNRSFKSIEDFLIRLPERFRKKELIEPLVAIGLFDSFESNRKKVWNNLDSLLVFVNQLGSLFAESSYNWQDSEDYTVAEKYQLEQKILGVGISPHPLKVLAKQAIHSYTDLSYLEITARATILVQIERIKIIRTKSTGKQMAFLSVTDTNKKLDVTVFPEVYTKYKEHLHEGGYYYLTGKINERNNRLQMLLEIAEEVINEHLWILLENHDYDQTIADILKKYPGNIPVIIHYQESKETLRSQHHMVEKTFSLEEELHEFVLKTVFR